MSEPEEAVLAAGWATVDLDRAAAELATLLAPGAAFEPAAPSEALGATCRIACSGGPPAPAPVLVLLEPATEGRLAAALARHGEGWCATWEAVPTGGQAEGGPLRTGPLGPERIAPTSPRQGPFRMVVGAATIEP